MRLISILLIVFFLFIFTPDSHGSSGLKVKPCYMEALGEEVLCGTLEVMENRLVRKGAKIKLNFIILPAWSHNPLPDPIFVFQGGPGGGAAEGVVGFARDYVKFRWDREIVLLDQRGTGDSNPLLCRPIGDPNSVQTWLKDMYPEDYVKKCRKELEEHANLRYYSTWAFAKDVDDLRAALGYQHINVIGGSYGGVSGYFYMKYYPKLEGIDLACVETYQRPPFISWQDYTEATRTMSSRKLKKRHFYPLFSNIKIRFPL